MKDRTLRILAIAAACAVLLVVLMGSLVTNTGSAYGCGNNWPLCNGQVIPTTPSDQTWIEFGHRFVSGLTSILVFIVAIWIWIRLKKVKEIRFLSISSVFFILLQAFLGMSAVVWGNSSIVLALHFGVSLLSFSSNLLIAFIVLEETNPNVQRIIPPIKKGMKWNFIILSIYTYILMYSGAFVRHTDSSLAATDFPTINGRLFPVTLFSRAGVQYIHRVLAFILLVWLVWTLIVCLRRYQNIPSLTIALFVSLVLILLQAVSGIFILKTHMALTFLLLHSFFVTLYFGILMIILMLGLRQNEQRSQN
ncbi:MAG: heme A synthase [Sporolactobacillus sp.]